MARIAVVEDDEFAGKMIGRALEGDGFQVDLFMDAESFLKYPVEHKYDLLILDIKLPGISGEDALKALRQKDVIIPIIMSTGIRDSDSKVNTLSAGADDYIEKPIDYRELLARVKAVLRRSQGMRLIPTDQLIKIGKFIIDVETREATSNIGDVTLSEKEIKLLKFFVQNSRTALSRADILEQVWGMDSYPTNRTVDNFVLRFRKLFEDEINNPRHFITVHSLGYLYQP